jgi:hypothetical protein
MPCDASGRTPVADVGDASADVEGVAVADVVDLAVADDDALTGGGSSVEGVAGRATSTTAITNTAIASTPTAIQIRRCSIEYLPPILALLQERREV